jgi:hypothetical protein
MGDGFARCRRTGTPPDTGLRFSFRNYSPQECVADEFLEPTRRQSGQGADGMTDEEIKRFALVLKECERIRAMIVREEAALSNGEHDWIPIAAAPPEQRPPVVLRRATAA